MSTNETVGKETVKVVEPVEIPESGWSLFFKGLAMYILFSAYVHYNAEGLMSKIVKENFRSSNEVISMSIDGWALLNGTRKCTVMIEDGSETYSTKATLTGDGVIWNMYIEIPGLEMFTLRMKDKIKKGH